MTLYNNLKLMERAKSRLLVLLYILILVGIFFYVDVKVVQADKRIREDLEEVIKCKDEEILELKREKSKLLKTNDSLMKQSPYLVGKVSWYGGDFHGNRMANGKIYDKHEFTAASPLIKGTNKPKYKFGTKLKVTNIKNKKSVVVTITDTGGFRRYGRELDLSKGAFDKIANLDSGVITVKIENLKCT